MASTTWRAHIPWRSHTTWRGKSTAAPDVLPIWDDPDEFYDVGPYGFASEVLLANTVFAGILDSNDASAWDHAQIGTHKLRMRQADPLVDGDMITIGGKTYRVIGTPQRLNRSEKIASLIMQS